MSTVLSPSQAPSPPPLPRTFRHRVLTWFWNLVNAVISGAATAGGSVMAGQVSGAVTFTQRQFWCIVVSGGVTAAFNYVRKYRLPPMFDADAETETGTGTGTAP